MIVPTVRTDLDTVNQQRVTNSAFHHPSREQALAAETCRGRVIETVDLLRRLRLARQVNELRGFCLHSKCQLVRVDASGKFRVVGPGFEMTAVERRQYVEFAALLRGSDSIRPSQIQNRRTARPQQRALIRSRQITVRPHGGPIHRRSARILNHDVTGHIAVR